MRFRGGLLVAAILAGGLARAALSPRETAVRQLRAGQAAQAVRELQDAADPELACLEVVARQQAGLPLAPALGRLDPEAPCAGRSGFLAAEALDPGASFAEQARLGQALLGERRELPLARALEATAEERLAARPPQREAAAQLLTQATTLSLPLAEAARLAERALSVDPEAAVEPSVADRWLLQDPSPAARALLARLDPYRGLALLAPEDEGPRVDALLRAYRPEDAWLLASARVDPRRVERLDTVPRLLAEDTPAAALLAASRQVAAGRGAEALATLQVLLTRWPASPERAAAEQLSREQRVISARRAVAAGDPATALADYDQALREGAEGEVALEAAWVARSAGRLDEAEQRLAEVAARWPNSAVADQARLGRARLISFDRQASEEAAAWLRAEGADHHLETLAAPDVRLSVDEAPRKASEARVRLSVRNRAEVELRLHPIDVAAFVRQGGTLADLEGLDVAVIAPERRWTVTVPGGAQPQETSFDVPIPGARPGLFAVTAALPDREAKVLLRVGDGAAVARVVGPDLALAAFREGAPWASAEVLVRDERGVTTGRTDRSGLYRGLVQGSATVVVEGPGGPSLLELRGATPPVASTTLGVELERLAVRSGDNLGFRLRVTRDGRPWSGPVVVSAEGVRAFPLPLVADDWGQVVGELPVAGENQAVGSLQVRLPDGTTLAGGAFRIVEPQRLGHWQVQDYATHARLTWFDPLGWPQGGARVRGEVAGLPFLGALGPDGGYLVPAHPAGVDFGASLEVDGERRGVSWRASPPPDPELRADLREARLRPGQAGEVRVNAEGGWRLEVLARRTPAEAPLPSDPYTRPLDPTLRVWTPAEPAPGWPLSEPVHAVDGRGEADLVLPVLPEGLYQVRLVRLDGRSSLSLPLEVSGAPRLRGLPDLGIGQEWSLQTEGGSMLVTAERHRILAAAVVVPGREVRWAPEARWGEAVSVVASSPEAPPQRQERAFDPTLDVELRRSFTAQGRLRVEVEVRDRAGRVVPAQVSLTATALELEPGLGVPWCDLTRGVTEPALDGSGGRSGPWTDGGLAEKLSGQLLAEAEREAEKKRLEDVAGRGFDRLDLGEELMVEDQRVLIGSAGSVGHGSGYGRGGGAFGAGSSVHNTYEVEVVAPVERWLWAVGRTDASGRWVWEGDGPQADAVWRLRAVAVSREATGLDVEVWDPEEDFLVRRDQPGPAQADDAVAARLGVWQRAGAAGEARLQVEGQVVPVPEAPGALPAGRLALLGADGEVVWAAPAPVGAPPPWVGPGSDPAPSAFELALEEDPVARQDPGRAARAARVALALAQAPKAPEPDRLRARARGWATVALARPAGSAEAAAEVLRLAVEAQAWLELPKDELDRAEQRLRSFSEPKDRPQVVAGLAVAGRGVDEALLAVAQQQAESPEDKARLALALARLGRTTEARALFSGGLGDGPAAWEAARALGELPSAAPPVPVGHPGRLAFVLDRHAGRVSTWSRAEWPEGEAALRAVRLVVDATGRPATPPAAAWRVSDAPACGEPCRVGVGEFLSVNLDLTAPGWRPPAGLRVERGALWAAVPGTYRLRGSREGEPVRALTVVVEGDVGPEGVMPTWLGGAALSRLAQGEADAEAWWAAARPTAGQRASAAWVRWQQAGEPASRVAAFEELRVSWPEAPLTEADVLDVARAYAAVGRPERAVAVLRVALGASFRQSTAAVGRLEPTLGPLASLQLTRELVQRWPAVPEVLEAEQLLPDLLTDLALQLPEPLRRRGVTPTELRLQAAAWDQELLAVHPDADGGAEVALRLASRLADLGLWEASLSEARSAARRFPDSPLLDAFELVEASSLAELGRAGEALGVAERLATADYLRADGTRGEPPSRLDARLLLARLSEGRGDWERAREAYLALGSGGGSGSLEALQRSRLLLPQTVVLVDGPAKLPVQTANLEELAIRAYRVDLRTLFLRDGGLSGATQAAVAGISPAWSGERRVPAGPFLAEVELDLPLTGSGAWLVQLASGAEAAAALVVRSRLEVDALDTRDGRRITVLRGGLPASGVEVRALANGGVVAARTDLRGVALVPTGAPVLAFEGEDFAFSPIEPGGGQGYGYGGVPAQPAPSTLDGRLLEQRSRSQQRYQELKEEAVLKADSL